MNKDVLKTKQWKKGQAEGWLVRLKVEIWGMERVGSCQSLTSLPGNRATNLTLLAVNETCLQTNSPWERIRSKAYCRAKER